jgi:hypothetical protein
MGGEVAGAAPTDTWAGDLLDTKQRSYFRVGLRTGTGDHVTA